MLSKWLFFSEKLLAAGSLPPGPHRGKLLSCKQSSQTTSFKIVSTRFFEQTNVVTMQLLPQNLV